MALMDTGAVPEGLDADKPRTTAEILEQEKPAEETEKNENTETAEETAVPAEETGEINA